MPKVSLLVITHAQRDPDQDRRFRQWRIGHVVHVCRTNRALLPVRPGVGWIDVDHPQATLKWANRLQQHLHVPAYDDKRDLDHTDPNWEPATTPRVGKRRFRLMLEDLRPAKKNDLRNVGRITLSKARVDALTRESPRRMRPRAEPNHHDIEQIPGADDTFPGDDV